MGKSLMGSSAVVLLTVLLASCGQGAPGPTADSTAPPAQTQTPVGPGQVQDFPTVTPAPPTLTDPTPTVGGGRGKIAFSAGEPDGTFQIYTIRSDGSGLTRLTQGDVDRSVLAWSPDGRRILFQSGRPDSQFDDEVWVMNADGTDRINLSSHEAYDYGAVWSPDGMKIAFTSERDGNAEIYVVNANGSGLARLTSSDANDGGAAWSPDGRRIAFGSYRDGDSDIYVMDADGMNVRRLIGSPARNESYPVWSPDGAMIAFVSAVVLDHSVWVMNADGTSPRKVSAGLDADFPSWSPDGRWIAFGGFDTSDFSDKSEDVYLFEVATGELTQLTDGTQGYYPGPWAPDSKSLVVEAGPNTAMFDLFIIDIDGSGLRRLTHGSGQECCAAWQPMAP